MADRRHVENDHGAALRLATVGAVSAQSAWAAAWAAVSATGNVACETGAGQRQVAVGRDGAAVGAAERAARPDPENGS